MTMNINLKFHPGYQPPKESGDYYCITVEDGMIQTLPYSAKWNRFNMRDRHDADHLSSAIMVRWWAEIPKAVQVPYGKGMTALKRRWLPCSM